MDELGQSVRKRVREWWAHRMSDRAAARMARDAIERYYGVPYLREITPAEHHGMIVLERLGEVERDEGLSGETHWHRR